MKRDLRIERTYAHSPERVWRALTDPRALAEWLMANDFEARVGHTFQFRDRPRGPWDGIVHCEVVECEAPRRLAYTWRGNTGLDTRVTWTLEPAGAGTRLTLEHTGFEGFGEVLLSFMMGAGWKKMLRKKLEGVIARGEFKTSTAPAGC
jgi:uncharacterized protein YndB with AHSA1/START domain